MSYTEKAFFSLPSHVSSVTSHIFSGCRPLGPRIRNAFPNRRTSLNGPEALIYDAPVVATRQTGGTFSVCVCGVWGTVPGTPQNVGEGSWVVITASLLEEPRVPVI